MTFGHTIKLWCSRWHEFVKLFHIVLIEDQTRNSNICLRDQIVETLFSCHDVLRRYGYIYLMKHKSETFEKFKKLQSEVENHRDKKIKFLRSDRGDEYLSYEFGLQLKQCGIVLQIYATWNTTA